MPENPEKYKLTGEDLIATIKEHKAEKAREEEAMRQINDRQQPQMMPGNMTPEQMREYFQNLTPEQREAMRQQRGAGGQGMGQRRPGGATADTVVRVITREQ